MTRAEWVWLRRYATNNAEHAAMNGEEVLELLNEIGALNGWDRGIMPAGEQPYWFQPRVVEVRGQSRPWFRS